MAAAPRAPRLSGAPGLTPRTLRCPAPSQRRGGSEPDQPSRPATARACCPGSADECRDLRAALLHELLLFRECLVDVVGDPPAFEVNSCKVCFSKISILEISSSQVGIPEARLLEITPRRSTLWRLASWRFAPQRSAYERSSLTWRSSFDHAFHIATPCCKIARCSSFAIRCSSFYCCSAFKSLSSHANTV